jgi:hypothetical protein
MISKFRAYRDTIAADGVKPLTFQEWLLGRIAGRLEVRVARLSQKRGDVVSTNHVLLALWAGNQSRGGHTAARLSMRELNRAIKEGRLKLVIDE